LNLCYSKEVQTFSEYHCEARKKERKKNGGKMGISLLIHSVIRGKKQKTER